MEPAAVVDLRDAGPSAVHGAGPDDRPEAASLGGTAPDGSATSIQGFVVTLPEFSGPFDLLLSLIAKHKLEVTELALHEVTDDFLAYIRQQGPEWNLEQATEFLVVAATLLDLKAARLLPSGEVEDEDDLELLEARDLLFARLLQYRGFKEASAIFAEMMAATEHVRPRAVGLDPEFAELLPEVILELTAEDFAQLAVGALTPPADPEVAIGHVHAPRVSVREQAEIISAVLRQRGSASFRQLVADAANRLVVVGRFLALLELYREGAVRFEQAAGLAELHIRWAAGEDERIEIDDEFDDDVDDVDDLDASDVAAGEYDAEDDEDVRDEGAVQVGAPGGADDIPPGPRPDGATTPGFDWIHAAQEDRSV